MSNKDSFSISILETLDMAIIGSIFTIFIIYCFAGFLGAFKTTSAQYAFVSFVALTVLGFVGVFVWLTSAPNSSAYVLMSWPMYIGVPPIFGAVGASVVYAIRKSNEK
jgi:hypothetical protein